MGKEVSPRMVECQQEEGKHKKWTKVYSVDRSGQNMLENKVKAQQEGSMWAEEQLA